jgi:leucyl aminopeptidase (aminopeptidase T)
VRGALVNRGAFRLVGLLGRVSEETRVVVLADFSTLDVAEPLVAAAFQLTKNVLLGVIPPRTLHGEELPDCVSALFKQADLVVAPMKTNIAHTSARFKAQASGTRFIVLPEATLELLMSPSLEADFEAIAPKVEYLADRLTKAGTARVSTPLGTDITMSLEGRTGRALTGFPTEKEISAGPCIEASIAPIETSANGRIIVDASIPGIGLIDEPFTIEVSSGRVTSMSGGPKATEFAELLRRTGDPNIYHIAELGIGMNPKCELEGSMLTDEGVAGTVHIAFGTSAYIGGVVEAAGHYDVLFGEASIELDGDLILADGQVIVRY